MCQWMHKPQSGPCIAVWCHLVFISLRRLVMFAYLKLWRLLLCIYHFRRLWKILVIECVFVIVYVPVFYVIFKTKESCTFWFLFHLVVTLFLQVCNYWNFIIPFLFLSNMFILFQSLICSKCFNVCSSAQWSPYNVVSCGFYYIM